MHWITAGFLMFFSSVAMYLLVRRAVALNINPAYTNMAMFAVPTGMFLILAWVSGTDLTVTWYQFAVLFVLAYFFSYLGNIFSLKSIAYAPNPGYSLVISKSYVVFTSVASVFLFGSVLSFRSALAIALIVLCSAVITIDPGKTSKPSHVRASWILFSIGSFFCWGMLTLTSKYLLNIGVNVFSRLIYSMSIVSVLSAYDIYRKRLHISSFSVSQLVTLFGIGVLSASFNYGMQQGFVTTPNVGYINAMNAASIGLVVVGAAIFFRDELTVRKFAGVIGVVAGLILLVV